MWTCNQQNWPVCTDPDPISAAKTPARDPPNRTTTLTPLTISSFQSPVGTSVPIPESPAATFQLIFTPSLIEQIVQQSNLYAHQVMEPGKFEQWKNISSIESEAYLGFSILIWINSLPSLDDYWSTDPALNYSPIADKISRDRFQEISRYLHFQDNSKLLQRGSPGYDRLGKVRPIVDHMEKCFPSLYNLHLDTSVDEAMVKYTGRSTLKQYIPMKPTKRGIKVSLFNQLSVPLCWHHIKLGGMYSGFSNINTNTKYYILSLTYLSVKKSRSGGIQQVYISYRCGYCLTVSTDVFTHFKCTLERWKVEKKTLGTE